MSFPTFLTGLLPIAHASSIEQLGSGSPGIDAMWAALQSNFPHTDVGSGGLALVALSITNFILRMIGALAVLIIIYAGIRMIISHGSEEGFTEAKKILTYTVLGLILVLCADAIVTYVMTVLMSAAGGA